MAISKIKPQQAEDVSTGIDNRARKEVAECLSHMLGETYMLQLKTQYYHWNVTGAHFKSLHVLFEEQYNALSASVDEIAERIRVLGYTAPGTFREFSELATIKEDKSLPADWRAMVKNLVAGNEALSRHARLWIGEVQKAGDEGTADLFIRKLQEHEKAAWMLRSHLE